MRKLYSFLFMAIFLAAISQAQENPIINKKAFFNEPVGIEKAKQDLKIAEKYYRGGSGTYDEALKHYLNLYRYNPNSKALNYKIGACYLWTSNKKASLPYLLSSDDSVATDYYLLLGRAYQYNLKFAEAKEAYSKYMESLTKWQRFDARKQYNQLFDECNAAEVILKDDSLPVFIVNLGPVVNSYYDDYGAYLLNSDTALYFTSKRPEKEPLKKKSRFSYKEQLLVSNNCLHQPSNYANPIPKIASNQNISLAGVDRFKHRIFYYKGGINNGILMKADFNGKKWKTKKLKGKINHIAYQETSISIAYDSMVYFVTNRRGGQGGKDIWVCKQKRDNRYSKPKNLGKTINTAFDEEGVYITPDGKTLYFSSKGRKGMGGFDVYKSEKLGDTAWSEPKNMGHPINSTADELFYHPTNDSMVAIYSTIREGGYGGLDIYKIQVDPRKPFKLVGSVSDLANGKILPAKVTVYEGEKQKPMQTATMDTLSGIYILNFEDKGVYNLQVDLEGYKSVSEAVICPDIKNATTVMDFKLEKLRHPFTLVGRITDIETNKPIQAAISFLQVGGDTLIGRTMSVDSTGNYSITFEDKYDMIMNVEAKDYYGVQEPVNTLNETNAIVSKNIELKRSKIDYVLTGIITQEDQSTPVYAAMSFYMPGETEPFSIVVSDSVTGKYSVVFGGSGPFLLEVEAKGFFFLNEALQFSEGQTLIAKNYALKKMESGVKIVIENILFASGKATLLPTSFKELDKLADLLKTNPNVRIEVSGHTDNVGSAATNKKISKERALTVRNYLVSKGIEETRLEYQGYGFDQPIAPNDTPEGKAQNRRVEIKILK